MNTYCRFPSIWNDLIAFVCDDDLWVMDAGLKPQRLTNGRSQVTFPVFSPDGKYIAFTAYEEGANEIYVIPSKGGEAKRITYLGAASTALKWTSKSEILFRTNAGYFTRRQNNLFVISPDGGSPRLRDFGPANHISFEPSGRGVVLGRNTGEPARWKRYKGGTAGELWIDLKGDFKYKKLIDLKSNLTCPLWIGERIYFISDHEGNGNLYSVNKLGKNIKKHSDLKEYYARNLSTDGRKIIFHAGGDLFVFDTSSGTLDKLIFHVPVPKMQARLKFDPALRYLEDFHPAHNGKSITFSARGNVFAMENFHGPAYRLRNKMNARYRLPKFLKKDNTVIAVDDESGEEEIRKYDFRHFERGEKICSGFGRAVMTKISPAEDKVVLLNHKQEIMLIDIVQKRTQLVHRNKFGMIAGLNFSPDGKFLTYAAGISGKRTAIFLYDTEKKRETQITDPVLQDHSPSFSPDGKYIYFIGVRVFNPVYDQAQFELSFPKAEKIYAIPLRADVKAPGEFMPFEEPPATDPKDTPKEAKKKEEKKITVSVDYENIKNRIRELPFPLGIYGDVEAEGKKIFALTLSPRGSLGDDFFDDDLPQGSVVYYDIEKKKYGTFISNVSYYYLTKEYIFVRIGRDAIKVFSNAEPVPAEMLSKSGREGGNIDLSRASVLVDPVMEWKQMYGEAWRLQRDNFWTENMSHINWKKVFDRYYVLLDRISTRAEFSDIIWEMQGELGTSHCYEFGGDYRHPANYPVGALGAEFSWSDAKKGWEIKRIYGGDSWEPRFASPLQTPGYSFGRGDVIKKVNGISVKKNITLGEMLLNEAGKEVELLVKPASGKKDFSAFIKAVGNETNILYREWVEKNRKLVHEKTKGRTGYVHIPDMGPFGFSEFHRYYLSEVEHDSLIVDVRFNGGGHVSPLILEKLKRKRIGYDIKRWGKPEPYPSDSVLGPIVVLTNEHAGSDGDIFSHSSKLMELGKLIGKRTWGGVIGIWPRHFLSDGTITTQPEFSFWFTDVGWGVENYGTDPHIPVENYPEDYKKGYDRQLDTAISEILKDLKKKPPVHPDFKNRPNLNPDKGK